MIVVPALLSLRNFLCYRDNCPPLDFTGVQVACLTGDNGNGKSALLDAMTWALWGQARARTDDELIYLGRTEMEVEFEFHAGDQRYRVIRKRRKGTQRSSGSTSLEFHLSTGDGWKPLTMNHVRDTESRIRDVLKLDYETFVNSAFLLQGRADAFTIKTPGERKRILAEILGLSQYDELEQEARYERGLRDDQVRSLERELAEIVEALSKEPGFLAEKQEMDSALSGMELELLQESQTRNQLRQAARFQEMQREQAAAAEQRRAEAEREVARAREDLKLHEQERQRLSDAVADEAKIEAGYQRLLAAVEEERDWGKRLAHHAELSRRRGERQADVERARQELATRVQLLQATVDGLKAAVEGARSLGGAQSALAERSAALERDQSRLDTMRNEEQALREEVGALRSRNVALRLEMESIKRKQNELGEATVCPLCKTELGRDGQAHVVEAYETEGRRLAADFRDNRARIDAEEKRAATLKKGIETLDLQLRQSRDEVARESTSIGAALREAEKAAEQLPRDSAEHDELIARLSAKDFAPEAQAQLRTLDAEIASLDYQAAAHQQARSLVAEYQPFDGRFRELGLAKARWESERAASAAAERLLADWNARLSASVAECDRIAVLLVDEPDLAVRLAATEARCEGLQSELRRYQQALGAIEQKLDDCARMRRLEALKSTALKQSLEERRIYEDLTAAFSRRGIQALIIDHVIPEITEEANRLLARMTNNRMQVMIDTQRQTQKGSVAETLDIRISDDLGTRNYELFSGGEAFRVNLALRIALSKLLARRAGAPLPTLVIDEGFGSQDPAALERLVEAINVIQEDFRCLLVITHLPELRDQFPVQIAVSKTAEGSVAAVMS
jgi:exonuclease SbcC